MQSFKYAFAGIYTLIKDEHNARIHFAATIIVVAGALLLKVSKHDWVILIIAIGLVWITEGINTAIEKLANAITTDDNIHIKKAKDVAAAVVLISAVVAVILGVIVFVPHLFH